MNLGFRMYTCPKLRQPGFQREILPAEVVPAGWFRARKMFDHLLNYKNFRINVIMSTDQKTTD